MAYKPLRNNIITLLNQITEIAEVSKDPRLKFDSFPAVFVAPSGNENDYLTQNENYRHYAFNIWAFTNYVNEDALPDAYDVLMDIADLIINKFDEQESPDSDREIGTGLQNYETACAVKAVPGQFMLDQEVGLLGVMIRVTVDVSVELTQL